MDKLKVEIEAVMSRLCCGSEQPSSEIVEGLEGGFIIRNVCTSHDCNALQDLVRKCITEDEAIKREKMKIRAQEVESRSASEKASSHSDIDHRRRYSQHHTPLRVAHECLSRLAKRIRPFLARVAGPHHRFQLDDAGSEISSFLRLYDYNEGEFSSPHYDRSFTWHEHSQYSLPLSPTSSSSSAMGSKKAMNGGRLVRFTAYSMILYLNDDFEGGQTTFFPELSDNNNDVDGDNDDDDDDDDDDEKSGNGKKMNNRKRRSNRGNTPRAGTFDPTMAPIKVQVHPRTGDVLVFPHGRQPGCYPDPLHEGSVVTSGRKSIIRTDVIYVDPKISSDIPSLPLDGYR